MTHVEAIRYRGTLGEKSLFERALGKFYTPELIAGRLATHLVDQIDYSQIESFSLVDPFCGDGRLIVAFLRQSMEREAGREVKWYISLWDYDPEAVREAQINLEGEIERLGIDAELDFALRDSFLVSEDNYGQYDCVVTNPPWDTLKPDSRELAVMSADDSLKYRAALKEYDRLLADVLPHSQPERKYAGWGTNLSRSGVELALKLTKPGGICGVVSPMTLLNDQISTRLRRWIFTETTPYHLDYYPGEAKLFNGVDQETISVCFRMQPTSRFTCTIAASDRNGSIVSQIDLETSQDVLRLVDYCLPVKHGDVALQLFTKWRELPKLEDLEGVNGEKIWVGRELDETGYTSFMASEGRYRFLKGRMISRYGIIEQPTQFVAEELKRVPDTASRFRIVWRDVSRRSQVRRVQAAIIPPGFVTGNSLNVLHLHNDDLEKLQMLLVVMNSIPFEFQVRSRLGTGHISASVVKKIHLPRLVHNPYLSRVPDFFKGLSLKEPNVERDLEIIVAKAYGLNRDEYEKLLNSFESVADEYKTDLLANWDTFD